MPSVHIARNGQQIGKYSEKEVADGLASGRFLSTDLYWHEGMPSWEQLSKFHNLQHKTEQVESKISGASQQPTEQGEGITWEAKDRNFMVRWWNTTINCLINPNSTFKTMPVRGGLSAPLIFYIFSASLATAVMSFSQTASQLIIQSNQDGEKPPLHFSLLCGIPFIILLAALFGSIGAILCSGITHLFLSIFGAANSRFEGTFRAVCYSLGSANSLQIIPLIGTIFAFFWAPVIFVISLKETHKTDYWRVILAVILPLVFCGIIFCFGILPAIILSDQNISQ